MLIYLAFQRTALNAQRTIGAYTSIDAAHQSSSVGTAIEAVTLHGPLTIHTVEGFDDDGNQCAVLLYLDKIEAVAALITLKWAASQYGERIAAAELSGREDHPLLAAVEASDDVALASYFPELMEMKGFTTYRDNPWHAFDALMNYTWGKGTVTAE